MDNYAAKGMAAMSPDMSHANLEKDLKGIRKALNSDHGGHELDLYEVARVDLKVSAHGPTSFPDWAAHVYPPLLPSSTPPTNG
jgi:hypothetical protein